MRFLYISLVAILLLPAMADADATETEIEYLVSTIGASDCTFIRNGREHNAADAEKHLRTKYRRAKRYAATTEKFINNLASRSSMSKKPYMIECNGQPAVETGTWLKAKLDVYRASNP